VRILLVEGSPKTAASLVRGLAEVGFTVDVAHDGDTAVRLGRARKHKAVIIDVGVPRRDGFSVLRDLRALGVHTPAILLSARSSIEDRVRALNLGADDYLTRPFAFRELLARLRAVIRRGSTLLPDRITIADLAIDTVQRRVTRGDQIITLTPKEYKLLWLLARRAGQVLSRSVIADQVWGIGFSCDSNVVDVHIRQLRKKIDGPFPARLIHTIRGVGYVIELRAQEADANG
jgi:two-component system copper resistance phosphate regulon response regulator CusR